MKKTAYIPIVVYVAALFAVVEMTYAKEQNTNNTSFSSLIWSLPPAGPKAVKGKKILYVATDLKNGGILGVAEGLEEAAKEMEWELVIVDGGGDSEKIRKAFQHALNQNMDGVILGGMNANKYIMELRSLADANTKIVCWHCSGKPGPVKGTPVQVNVTTDPRRVAELSTAEVIKDNSEKVGVIIFTDSNYEIALTKSYFMEYEIRKCSHCRLLEIVDLNLSEKSLIIQDRIKKLLNKYGSRWTHSLGINDLYFDFAAPVFATYEENYPLAINNISAGDGSYSAYLRIKYGGLQHATIPEPLLLHGWQLVDELNRLFNNKPPSNYIAPVIVITEKNILTEVNENNLFDPLNNYRKVYRDSWGVGH
ncbi:MAG: substrate-binding domain-containing protein [Nitrospina sp.]|jgi:ribose transport system substrate-binding protein|nr:substrate-binding domain-containing protein [Nitrospina sp.]MBT5633882.1 substrate-binding domain-containing protein [Nitrospina sp.]